MTKMKFEKSSTILDELLSYQWSPSDKTGIIYSKAKKVSNEQSSKGKTKSYVDVLKNSIKIENNRKEEQDVPLETYFPYEDRIKKTFPPRWNHLFK